MTRPVISCQCYGEILVQDVYGIRNLGFTPDVIYDIGAHVGLFTMAASVLFPEARIIAVEPHLGNYQALCDATLFLRNVIPIQAALGEGRVFILHEETSAPQVMGYMTEAHYNFQDNEPTWQIDVPTVNLEGLLTEYGGKRTLWKIDIEGEEESFTLGQMSSKPLHEAEYATMELHVNLDRCQSERVTQTLQWIESFGVTHDITRHGHILQMRKRAELCRLRIPQ